MTNFVYYCERCGSSREANRIQIEEPMIWKKLKEEYKLFVRFLRDQGIDENDDLEWEEVVELMEKYTDTK